MATAATIAAKLTLDTKDYDSGLDTAEKKAGNFSGKMKTLGGTLTKTGAMMTAGLTVPIVAGLTSAMNSASNLEQSMGGVESVFGESGNIITEFGKGAADSVGLSQRSFNELSTVGGALLQNLGFDADGAANEMVTLAERGADVAATFGGPVDAVLQAVQSALKGEFNPLEQFGVKMNAAAIEARALQMGLADSTVDMAKVDTAMLGVEKATAKYNEVLKKNEPDSLAARDAANSVAQAEAKLSEAMEGQTGAISDAAKAQAALDLFYAQTAKTQGQFASEADTLAGQTERLKAKFENLSGELGNQLLPIGMKVMEFLSGLIDKFNALTPSQQKTILVILGIVAAIGPLITAIGTLMTVIGTISGAFAAGGIFAAGGSLAFLAPFLPIIAIIAAVIAIVILLKKAWENNWGDIQGITKATGEWISTTIENIGIWISDTWNSFTSWLTESWNNTWSGIQNTIQVVSNWFADIFATIGMTVIGAFNTIQNTIQTVSGWITSTIQLFLDTIKNLFIQGWTNIVDNLTNAWENIKEIFSIYAGFVRGIVEAFLLLIQGDFKGAGEKLKETVSNTWERIKDLFGRLLDGIIDKFNLIDWIQIGKDIINGLINGLKSMLSKLWDTVKSIASGVKDFFSGLLGISSPSKVFLGYGENLMKGLALGIKSATKLPENAIANMQIPGIDLSSSPVYSNTERTPNSQTSSMTNDKFIDYDRLAIIVRDAVLQVAA